MRHTSVRYGERRSQLADLFLPEDLAPRAVVVAIHGGFWRARLPKLVMHPLSHALVAHGYAVWNIEYRRVGRGGGGGGYPATLEDVACALDHLTTLADLRALPVVTCGHSAGGQLALWAAARHRLGPAAPGGAPQGVLAGAIALAGVVDLEEAHALALGNGATDAFLGGTDNERAARVAIASPAALLPLGVPQVLIHGLVDTVVPVEMSARYVERARAAGDDAVFVGLADLGHREVIAPSGPAFSSLLDHLGRLSGTDHP